MVLAAAEARGRCRYRNQFVPKSNQRAGRATWNTFQRAGERSWSKRSTDDEDAVSRIAVCGNRINLDSLSNIDRNLRWGVRDRLWAESCNRNVVQQDQVLLGSDKGISRYV
jgi:hypothetical protein